MPLNSKSQRLNLKFLAFGITFTTGIYFVVNSFKTPDSVDEKIARSDASTLQVPHPIHHHSSSEQELRSEDGNHESQDKSVEISETQQSKKGFQNGARDAFLGKLAQLTPIDIRYKDHKQGAQIIERLYHRPDYADPYLLHTTRSDENGKDHINVVVANEFLLQVDGGAFDEDRFKEANPLIGNLVHISGNSWRIGFTMESIETRDRIKSSLDGMPDIKGVYDNGIAYASAVPNDAFYTFLWASSNDGSNPLDDPSPFAADADSKIEGGWDVLTDCSAVPVAVLDTGVDLEHPELKDFINLEVSRDFTNSPVGIQDRFGHGTHVAGTIGAAGNNDEGVAGVCWKSELIIIKSLGDDGTGTVDGLIAAFSYAATTSAKVLNASLGSAPIDGYDTNDPNNPYFLAIKSVEEAGQILVAAAGNDDNNNDQTPVLPVSFESEAIIAVGALNPDNTVAQFSNFGESVDIAAPGVAILSTVPRGAPSPQPFTVNGANQDGYGLSQGTSMASPLVAGIVALYWAMSPQATAQEVKATLLENSVPLQLNKAISGGSVVNLTSLMDTVRVEFSTQGADALDKAAPREELTLVLDVTRTGAHALDKIQVFMTKTNGEEFIIEEAPADSGKVEFEMPLKISSSMGVRVTDVEGRVYDDMLIEEVFHRFIDFDAIDGLSGDTPCKIEVDGKDTPVWEGDVENAAACESLCEAVLPMLLSNNKINCGG